MPTIEYPAVEELCYVVRAHKSMMTTMMIKRQTMRHRLSRRWTYHQTEKKKGEFKKIKIKITLRLFTIHFLGRSFTFFCSILILKTFNDNHQEFIRRKKKKRSIKDFKDQSSIQFINDLNIFHLQKKNY